MAKINFTKNRMKIFIKNGRRPQIKGREKEDDLKKKRKKGRTPQNKKMEDKLKKKIRKMEDDLNFVLNGKRHKKKWKAT